MLNLQADLRLRRAPTLKETQLNTQVHIICEKSTMFSHNIVFEQQTPLKTLGTSCICIAVSQEHMNKHGGCVDHNVSSGEQDYFILSLNVSLKSVNVLQIFFART